MNVPPDDKTDAFTYWRHWFRHTGPRPALRRPRITSPLPALRRAPRNTLATAAAGLALGLAALAWALPARIAPSAGHPSTHTASGLIAVPGAGTVIRPGTAVTLPGTGVPGPAVTVPGSAADFTRIAPGSTRTVPGQPVTVTSALPGTTQTVPGQGVTSTETAPGQDRTVTATATQTVPGPTQTVTETVTAHPSHRPHAQAAPPS